MSLGDVTKAVFTKQMPFGDVTEAVSTKQMTFDDVTKAVSAKQMPVGDLKRAFFQVNISSLISHPAELALLISRKHISLIIVAAKN